MADCFVIYFHIIFFLLTHLTIYSSMAELEKDIGSLRSGLKSLETVSETELKIQSVTFK